MGVGASFSNTHLKTDQRTDTRTRDRHTDGQGRLIRNPSREPGVLNPLLHVKVHRLGKFLIKRPKQPTRKMPKLAKEWPKWGLPSNFISMVTRTLLIQTFDVFCKKSIITSTKKIP